MYTYIQMPLNVQVTIVILFLIRNHFFFTENCLIFVGECLGDSL